MDSHMLDTLTNVLEDAILSHYLRLLTYTVNTPLCHYAIIGTYSPSFSLCISRGTFPKPTQFQSLNSARTDGPANSSYPCNFPYGHT